MFWSLYWPSHASQGLKQSRDVQYHVRWDRESVYVKYGPETTFRKYQHNSLIPPETLDWQWGNFNWIASSIWASDSPGLSDQIPISRWHLFFLCGTQAGNFLANLHQMRGTCRRQTRSSVPRPGAWETNAVSCLWKESENAAKMNTGISAL